LFVLAHPIVDHDRLDSFCCGIVGGQAAGSTDVTESFDVCSFQLVARGVKRKCGRHEVVGGGIRGLSKGGLLALDVCLYLLDHHEEVMDELLIRVVWAGVRRVVVAEVKFETVKPTFDEKGRGFIGNDG
jgi:hypothetical protein